MTGKYEKADARKWKLRQAELRAQEAEVARAVIDFYNARLKEKKDPWFAPTIKAALVTKHHWLIVVCRSCDTVVDLDLRVKPRPPEATVLMALRDVRCPRCNGHGRPEVVRLGRFAR